MPLLVGVYDAPGPVADAAKRLRNRGFEDLEIYAPAPFPEIEDALDEAPSKVRIFTLIGGLIGGDAGKGAAIGGAVGGISGGIRNHDEKQQRKNFERAFAACIEGRGYSVN